MDVSDLTSLFTSQRPLGQLPPEQYATIFAADGFFPDSSCHGSRLWTSGVSEVLFFLRIQTSRVRPSQILLPFVVAVIRRSRVAVALDHLRLKYMHIGVCAAEKEGCLVSELDVPQI